jgi:hypothetical protein
MAECIPRPFSADPPRQQAAQPLRGSTNRVHETSARLFDFKSATATESRDDRTAFGHSSTRTVQIAQDNADLSNLALKPSGGKVHSLLAFASQVRTGHGIDQRTHTYQHVNLLKKVKVNGYRLPELAHIVPRCRLASAHSSR